MQYLKVAPGVTAVVRPEKVSNVGLVETEAGVVVIDTTSSAEEMQAVLDGAGVQASQVGQVILTHTDGDHIGGNRLFDSPILAHRIGLERMVDMEKPENERPSETFEEEIVKEIGGVQFELTHTGGHTPDSCVVWFPELKVLFSGDEIFERRYPYIHPASDVKKWSQVLGWLPSFGAEVIVPGHGSLSDGEVIAELKQYLDESWLRVADHVAKGDGLEKILADSSFPKIDDPDRVHLYRSNIERMVEMIGGQDHSSA